MLRALFNREELVKALELVGHVVPKRSPKPILACVRIESMNGMVKIGGTDLETAILVDFHTVQVEQDGLALLNLRDFLATLKASTSDVVKLEPHTGEFGPVWRIADEDAESTIAMEKCADYPPMPGRASGPLAGSFKVNRDHLSEAIGCVTWSAARPGGSNRFAYESICFSLANGRACLVTTNSRGTSPGSDIPLYIQTMQRLERLPVRLVHAGHDPSFDGRRLKQLARAYLDRH